METNLLSEENMEYDSRPEFAKKRVLVPLIVAVIFLMAGIFYSIYGIYYKSTDDAFVEGHISVIAPKVEGEVINLYIDDNDEVKKGDLLFEIDPEPYEIKLKQTQSQLLVAKANLKNMKGKVDSSSADVINSKHNTDAMKSELSFAKSDYARYKEAFSKGISSKQEFDSSKNKLDVAKSNYSSSLAKEKSLQSSLESSRASYEETLALIKSLEAQVESDKLNLSYTKIYAPTDGLVTNKKVELGNYVKTAEPVLSLVSDNVWIVANFKETQIANMKKGQAVKIKIDTYKNKKFKGEVDSIQRATGAKSSLFPPENAVGSYVKIVQRVPVKIIFKEDIKNYNIVPGMSCVPEVKVK